MTTTKRIDPSELDRGRRMTYEEAKRILHPDTTRDAIRELALDGVDAVKAAEQACTVACEAIDKVLASQWVPVSERLPELYDNVIAAVLSRDGYGMPAYFVTMAETRKIKLGKYLTAYIPISEGEIITHWMPLPEPPKEANK